MFSDDGFEEPTAFCLKDRACRLPIDHEDECDDGWANDRLDRPFDVECP